MSNRYWELVDKIPKGGFYDKDAIPFKIGVYTFLIDTSYPLESYDIMWNNEMYTVLSDISGLIYMDFFVDKGKNELKWKKSIETDWKWKIVKAWNIGTLESGIASTFIEEDDNISTVKNNASVLTATELRQWVFLYGIEETVSREQLEEIVQATWNWSEKEKVVKQISGALESVPVVVERIGPMILGGQWIVNNKYRNGLDGYEFVNVVSSIIVDDQDYFGKLLKVVGGSSEIYPTVEYRDEGKLGSWAFKFWYRWIGIGSGNFVIGGSVDGVNWVWSTITDISLNWRVASIAFDTKPIKVGIKFSGTIEFGLEFGTMELTNEELNQVLPQYTGAWNGRKAIAIWSYL